MAYENNSKKTTIVINEKINIASLLNAIGHITLGLATQVGSEELNMLEYPFKDDLKSSCISEYPVIILKSTNSSQLAKLRQGLEDLETPMVYNCFTAEMIGESAEGQISANLNAEQPEFWAIAIFGDAETLKPLTKKFSLYK
jgi:Protein of unknown function (DUF2000)